MITIAITGGPCSGKTSAKAVLMQKLVGLGVNPVFVPETATYFLSSGINIGKIMADKSLVEEFQRIVMEHQIEAEDRFVRLASMVDKAILICDRGVLDGAAYMDNETFERVVGSLGWSRSRLLARYQGVVHLVTAAIGAEDFYNYDNPARYETLEQARVLDGRIVKAWGGHPAFRIIGNTTGNGKMMTFDRKMDLLVENVCNLIGIPAPVENERKFLIEIEGNPLDWSYGAVPVEIVQAYLVSSDMMVERRIRQWRVPASEPLYFYTEKMPVAGSYQKRLEKERLISADDYIGFMSELDVDASVIRKTRYCFSYMNQYFELDVVRSPKKLNLLEVQVLGEEREIEFPSEVKVLREVTGERDFSNHGIALRNV